MQRILNWLGSRLFSEQPASSVRGSPAAQPLRRAIRTQAPKPVEVKQTKLVELRPEVGGRIESAGPGKNVLVQNKYIREDTGTHEKLQIVGDSLVDGDDPSGFDPYNTGKFDRAANWSRMRK